MNQTRVVCGIAGEKVEKFHLQEPKKPSLEELKIFIRERVDTAMGKLMTIKQVMANPGYLEEKKADYDTLYKNLEEITNRICWAWERTPPGE